MRRCYCCFNEMNCLVKKVLLFLGLCTVVNAQAKCWAKRWAMNKYGKTDLPEDQWIDCFHPCQGSAAFKGYVQFKDVEAECAKQIQCVLKTTSSDKKRCIARLTNGVDKVMELKLDLKSENMPKATPPPPTKATTTEATTTEATTTEATTTEATTTEASTTEPPATEVSKATSATPKKTTASTTKKTTTTEKATTKPKPATTKKIWKPTTTKRAWTKKTTKKPTTTKRPWTKTTTKKPTTTKNVLKPTTKRTTTKRKWKPTTKSTTTKRATTKMTTTTKDPIWSGLSSFFNRFGFNTRVVANPNKPKPPSGGFFFG